MHENLNEVTFVDKGGKTEMTLKVTVLRTTPEFAKPLEGMEQGWTQSLEKLEALLEGRKVIMATKKERVDAHLKI